MTTDVERLVVRLEANQRQFAKQLAAMNKTAAKNAVGVEKRFKRMNKSIASSAALSARSIIKLGGLVGASLGAKQVIRYADAWTEAGNKIRAAAQISGLQARSLSELNDIASETRGELTATVDLYAKLLRVSGPLGKSEIEVAKATEIVGKAFKAGGAAASEQAAGILQIGQALGSGFLQGDELRSIRENAPLIAQAIADEFETTIGGLKELGAEGELVSARVFDAIIKAQGSIDLAFSQTDKTVSEGFTLAKNSLIELIGQFDEGSKSSEEIGDSLAELSKSLDGLGPAAKRFGAQFREANEVASGAIGALTEKLYEFGDANAGVFTALGAANLQIAQDIIDVLLSVMSTASAAINVVGVAYTKAVASVGNASTGIANGVIGAIEAIINSVLAGIRKIIDVSNRVSAAANALNPFGDPAIILPSPSDLKLGRFAGGFDSGDIGLSEAFEAERAKSKAALDLLVADFIGVKRRIQRAGDTPFEVRDPRGNQISPPGKPGARSTKTITTAPDKGKGSGKGGGSKSASEAQKELNAQLREARSILEGNLTAREKLSAELARNIELLPALAALIRKEAREHGENITLAEAEARAKDEVALANQKLIETTEVLVGANQEFRDSLKSQFADVITGATSLDDALKNVLSRLIEISASSALDKLFQGFGSGGGASGLGKVVKSLFSFDGGGFTGGGTRTGGIDGRGGFPAILHPNETVIDHTKNSGQSGVIKVQVINQPSEMLDQHIQVQSAGVATQVVQSNTRAQDMQRRRG